MVIEKNSHFNYVFNFPRYSVVEGRESKAFIPYEGVFSSAPNGISEIVQGEVVGISETHVTLMTGEKVEFEYLAIATGAKQPVPARLLSSERDGGCKELRELQEKIKKARRIGIIGGGAVGVQLAGDISTFHSKDGKSEKEIVLVHSRDRLLNNFGERLGLYVEEKMKKLGVEVVLGERPVIGSEGREELVFGDGRRDRFDLIVSPRLHLVKSTTIEIAVLTAIDPLRRPNTQFVHSQLFLSFIYLQFIRQDTCLLYLASPKLREI